MSHYYGDDCPGGHGAANLRDVDLDDQLTPQEADARDAHQDLVGRIMVDPEARRTYAAARGQRWMDAASNPKWLTSWLTIHNLPADATPAQVLTAVGQDYLAYSTALRAEGGSDA